MNNNKRTVCLVIPSLHAGGMERVMAELASYFATKSYIDLHLVLYGIKRDVFYELPENITIHVPPFAFNNAKRLLSTIKTLWFLRKKINLLKPCAVLSFGEHWNSFVLIATLGTQANLFVSDRCQPDKFLGKKQELLRKWLYPKAKGIIAQTAVAKSVYQTKRLNNNIKVIGNPIRLIEHTNPREKANIVLTIGRLIKTKNHRELIKHFVKINKPGWKLVIVGDNALKQDTMSELQALVSKLAATDKVILAGKHLNVEEFYLNSKIFAFTSSSEGFPNVIGEAQSAGLPVIAFDCIAGPADMVKNNENGFLIPLFDYDLFERQLSLLMDDEKLREQLGTRGKHSIKQFAVDIIGDSYERFILGN